MAAYTLQRFMRPGQTYESEEEEVATVSVFVKLKRMAAAAAARKDADNDTSHLASILAKRLLLAKSNVEAEESEESLVSQAIGWVAKKLFKSVVKKAFRFAIRTTWQLARIALRSLVRYAVIPVIEFVSALAVANPITATILGVVGAAGLGYYLWKKYTGANVDDPASPSLMARVIDKAQELAAPVLESIPGVNRIPAVQRLINAQKTVQAIDQSEAINFIKEGQSKYKAKKFEGFGQSMDSAIKEASGRYGIPEDALRGFIYMEGGWRGAKSSTGALGVGQFTVGTWNDLARTAEGKAIGMEPKATKHGLDNDPRRNNYVNTLATALLAWRNAKALKQHGFPVTGANLYMLHNIGYLFFKIMEGKTLGANDWQALRVNGLRTGDTARDFVAMQQAKYEQARATANNATVTNSPALPALPESDNTKTSSASTSRALAFKPIATTGVSPSKSPLDVFKVNNNYVSVQ